jgi:phosphoribosylformimino-5-aminoimidazole carboxamide ribonucleotide (ProFAR) isomerase
VSSLGDMLAARAAGCSGAIVGRAIYEGRVDIGELMRALEGMPRHE